MASYTITLTEAQERMLEDLRFKDGGGVLDKPAFVQYYISRACDNHELAVRNKILAKAVLMSDQEFSTLSAERLKAIAAEQQKQADAAADATTPPTPRGTPQ